MSTRPEIELKIVKDLIDYDMVEDSDNETFFEASEKTSFVPASKPPTSQSPEEHMEYIPLKLQEGQASTGIDTTMVDADESTAEWGQDGVEEYGFSAKDNQMSDVFSSRASDIEAADSTNAELFNMSISEGLQTHDPAVALMFPEDNSFHESAFNRGSVGEEEDTADIIRLGELVGLGDSHMSDH
ncbi:hypothetical protein BGZ60DRAFT_398524 [Tricladium varicosporioides]|nr:hypothetical protein BGZ60DRAFT_398524 [Hymenoscyphus varicosporioides]